MNASPAPTAAGNFGLSNRKLGMLIFLASEAMFFTGLIGAYIVLRQASAHWPAPADFLTLHLGFLNTFILLASSFAFGIFIRRSQAENFWLAAAGLLGILFLAIQGYEYRELMVVKKLLPSSSLFGASFFTLTGFHGLHVLAGVLCMIVLRIRKKKEGLEILSFYWHFVGGVWLVLFGLLYF